MVLRNVSDSEEAGDDTILGMFELHELTVRTEAVVCLVSQSGTVGGAGLVRNISISRSS